MKWTLPLFALLAAPAFAETPPAPELSEGMGLIERGIQMLMEGMISEAEPQLKEMARTLEELQGKLGPAIEELSPKLIELMRLMGDLDQYEMPQKLPNGDIIIRRAPDPGTTADPGGSIDL